MRILLVLISQQIMHHPPFIDAHLSYRELSYHSQRHNILYTTTHTTTHTHSGLTCAVYLVRVYVCLGNHSHNLLITLLRLCAAQYT
jgi:hypothetical protein